MRNNLHPDVVNTLKLPKRDTPRPLMATECSLASPERALADAKPQQHKHSITVEQFNTADVTAPVAHRAVVTDKQRPEQFSYKGLSVSPEQFLTLTKQQK